MSTKGNNRSVTDKVLAVLLASFLVLALFSAFSQPSFADPLPDPSGTESSDATEQNKSNKKKAAAREFADICDAFLGSGLISQPSDILVLSKGTESFSLSSVARPSYTADMLFWILSSLWSSGGLTEESAPQPLITAPYVEQELGDGFELRGDKVLVSDSVFELTADSDSDIRFYSLTLELTTTDPEFNEFLAQWGINALGKTTVTFAVILEPLSAEEKLSQDLNDIFSKVSGNGQGLTTQSQKATEIGKGSKSISLSSLLILNAEGETLFNSLSSLWESSESGGARLQQVLTAPLLEEELGDGFELRGDEVVLDDSVFERTAADGNSDVRTYAVTVALTTDDAAFNEFLLAQKGISEIAKGTVEFSVVLDPVVSDPEDSKSLARGISVSLEGFSSTQSLPSQAVPLAGDLLSNDDTLSPLATVGTPLFLYQSAQLVVITVIVVLGLFSLLRLRSLRSKAASRDVPVDKHDVSAGSVRMRRSDYLD